MDLLHPDFSDDMTSNQEATIDSKPFSFFTVGDNVYVRNYSTGGQKRLEGTINVRTVSLSYRVRTSEGLQMNRHLDQICNRHQDHNSSRSDSQI